MVSRSFIKKRYPLVVKLMMSPFAMLGMIVSMPLALLIVFADFDKAAAIIDFWTEQQ